MSKIEWTEATWNPVTGCTKVSAGCKHCYAETLSRRLHAMGVNGYENGFVVSTHSERLDIPLRRKKPTMWFVNSMSDMFHPQVEFAFVDEVMRVISQTPQHTYQILTKRPGRMRRYFSNREAPPNTWLGTSVENKKHGVPRIDELREIKAKVRFLSVEPLLEDIGKIKLKDIHWVIVGGESGKGARPMQEAWVDNIKKQCSDAKVKFFFKQWGAWGKDGVKRSKKANGRTYKGRHWDQMPARLKSVGGY
ncbi:phage Gp37/Gp68 family protein [Candidatus Spongiihabitans sp.]|uniref:phage Gp37/Gp68 family protein n=1 Tax=Candidatus Spongiihabitans sp. TaxID=3101308 RepID=UPI003C7CCAB8